ncbi:CheB methylesterase [Paraburkholderia sp. BL27I4N3]|uniref:chemotaxis protein CheB n=1 Tax=Paraburkholderia sp. BL27I4N3 TaxID=1938805 RepID=UPI000E25253C|nr:chemotaxis protein CheB [Paraburkholderia sp. BL27I4N3]REE18357.1 CheB methylesterase [Paraburkholderia sp. BL27I4N3]
MLSGVVVDALQADSCLSQTGVSGRRQPISASTVYVAPPDRHMLMRDGLIILSTGPKENFARPAADPLFRSAAVEYGPRAIGVILTGRLDDGAAGLKAVGACGGFTIVQEPSSCVAPEMPKAALQAVSPNRVVPTEDIAASIVGALRDDLGKGVSMDERGRIPSLAWTRRAVHGARRPME